MSEERREAVIRVYGIVQGVGFRPFVSRIADQHQIAGSVCNKGPYVEIAAGGNRDQMEAFLSDLEHRPPERAVILKIDVEDLPAGNVAEDRFSIIESAKEEGEIFVSPDIATCPTCRKELFDPSNRRYLHPFINCTSCGPRVTILDGMPYDRERTSMKEFPMCPSCEYEYTHAETRRYDAQPVCCNDCGPRVYLLPTDKTAPLPVSVDTLPPDQTDAAAITAARRTIAEGGIVAIKGIGGFHLCCDATSEAAVALLRSRKRRPVKPFAVMMRDLDTVKRECELPPEQAEVLDGHQKPIILLKKKKQPDCRLAPSVAPGNPTVGVMLPYAPVQMLLFTYTDSVKMPDCLVMTSGNISGAPICRDDESARTELSQMCDLILSHNRRIRLRADDSVMDFYKGRPYMIRRSRGYAPLPFLREAECSGTVLAIGGELKNTFCIGRHHLFYPSPYVGDMADIRTIQALRESIARMEDLLEARPELVACDMHPKYHTVEVAESLGLPVVQVQHHYAHILSCMAENEWEEEVIGVSFDGTGYGTDHTIWGGEFLRASVRGFTRLGSIDPFLQIGGDASSREGWRIAVSMLLEGAETREKAEDLVRRLELCDEKTMKVQEMMADRRINSVSSTSAGRLFDAVSAVLGICRQSSFEGEASMALEFAAESWEESHPAGQRKADSRQLGRAEDGRFLLPTRELFLSLAASRLSGRDPELLAWKFHRDLAEAILAGCREAERVTGLHTVALSGGVFQNRLLLRMTEELLSAHGFRVLLHSMVPANDGGIALGQAVYAMEQLNQRKKSEKEN
ncbi:hydrogenase maturation factor [Clostridium sp. SY8519]|uniref:carbamoyltransferase HypF n=1 Tax=Clostridium sp. (strain SY8519) TaxID=1042156 RepID=UPI0002171A74|nr:carbamoyltransferase HypF [Clostridium sp. SY8519]BAK47525.1 hydrogenase maturation factor [Clostridium sp. SY8519]